MKEEVGKWLLNCNHFFTADEIDQGVRLCIKLVLLLLRSAFMNLFCFVWNGQPVLNDAITIWRMAILCDNSTKQNNLEEYFCSWEDNKVQFKLFKTCFETLHVIKVVISARVQDQISWERKFRILGRFSEFRKFRILGRFSATEMPPQYSLPISSVYCLEIWIVFHKCSWAD